MFKLLASVAGYELPTVYRFARVSVEKVRSLSLARPGAVKQCLPRRPVLHTNVIQGPTCNRRGNQCRASRDLTRKLAQHIGRELGEAVGQRMQTIGDACPIGGWRRTIRRAQAETTIPQREVKLPHLCVAQLRVCQDSSESFGNKSVMVGSVSNCLVRRGRPQAVVGPGPGTVHK